MQKTRIVLLSIAAAVAYGIVHDQITVRLCIEYFTVAHPPIFHTRSPTLLAVCWGAVATFWVGLALGSLLAMVTQSRGRPPVPLGRLARGMAVLLATMGVCAAGAGVAGFELTRHGVVTFPAGLVGWIPAAQQERFMAMWFAHNTSYLVGFVGGGGWIYRLWRERGCPRVLSPLPRTGMAWVRAAVLIIIIAAVLYYRLARR